VRRAVPRPLLGGEPHVRSRGFEILALDGIHLPRRVVGAPRRAGVDALPGPERSQALDAERAVGGALPALERAGETGVPEPSLEAEEGVRAQGGPPARRLDVALD